MVEVAVGLPSPTSLVSDALTGLSRSALSPLFDGIGAALVRLLAQGASEVGEGLVTALSDSASIDFDGGWWRGPRVVELTGIVGGIADSLTLAFLFLALLRGLAQGDPGGMLRTALGQVPISVLGMATLVGATGLLVGVTDEATNAVLRNAPEDLAGFVTGFGKAAPAMSGGLAAVLLMFVFLVGALLVWAELIVRSALVYLLVAFAPLTLAARIWPSTRGAFRRLCQLGVALIVSKFAVALALALGAAALGGGAPGIEGKGDTGLSLAGLLGGATLMGLAAFTPFVVLRLLPAVEEAVVAQGITRSPARGAQMGVAMSAYPARLTRLAGAGGAVSGAAGAGVVRPGAVPRLAPAGSASASREAPVGRHAAPRPPFPSDVSRPPSPSDVPRPPSSRGPEGDPR